MEAPGGRTLRNYRSAHVARLYLDRYPIEPAKFKSNFQTAPTSFNVHSAKHIGLEPFKNKFVRISKVYFFLTIKTIIRFSIINNLKQTIQTKILDISKTEDGAKCELRSEFPPPETPLTVSPPGAEHDVCALHRSEHTPAVADLQISLFTLCR